MRLLRRALVICVVMLTSGEIDRGEYLCEEAHAKLKKCCGEKFQTETSFCTQSSCGSPQLGMGSSECILDLSCEKIRDADICTRVMQIGETGAAVCP
ncbi:MAG: hypothetical protein HYV09_15570 [Deltaproteobacteria bacterium]|nr:hypothetical protein [Deltaproteobacteria bacterium]